MALYYYEKNLDLVYTTCFTTAINGVINYDKYFYGSTSNFSSCAYSFYVCTQLCSNYTNIYNVVSPYWCNFPNACLSRVAGDRSEFRIECYSNDTTFYLRIGGHGSNTTSTSTVCWYGNFNLNGLFNGELQDGCSITLSWCDVVSTYSEFSASCAYRLYGYSCWKIDQCTLTNDLYCCLTNGATVSCTYNRCLNILKLTGVNCYQISLNGLLCYCLPKCSLDKIYLRQYACAFQNGTGVSRSIISNKLYCITTNDGSICVFNNINGVNIYYYDSSSYSITSGNSLISYGLEYARQYSDGRIYYGTPIYISTNYSSSDQSTWSIECEALSKNCVLTIPINKRIGMKMFIPSYGSNSCMLTFSDGTNSYCIVGSGAITGYCDIKRNVYWYKN